MAQTSVNMIAGDDARASDINKIVADISEIYSGGPGVPVGGVIYWWSDNSVPLNYKVCDGTVVSDVASPINGLTLPNLINQFIRGVANSNVRTTPVSGGADTHTLSWNEMPPHSHGVSDPGHSHALRGFNGSYPGGNGAAEDGSGVEWTRTFDTRGGGVTGSGTGIWINNAGGGAAHNNIPAYRGLVPIMRYK